LPTIPKQPIGLARLRLTTPFSRPRGRSQNEKRQTSTRVGWNGGLGWWAVKQCRVFSAFALGFFLAYTVALFL